MVMFPPYDVSQVKTTKTKPQMTGGESGADIVSCAELHHRDTEPCVLFGWFRSSGNSLSLLYSSHSFLPENNKHLRLKNETSKYLNAALNVFSD